MDAVRLARAAELLGVTRPTVEQWIREGRLTRVEGTAVAMVAGEDLLRELVGARVGAAARLAHLDAAIRSFGDAEDTDPSPSAVSTRVAAGGLDLAEEVIRERTGRALAEARIDDLKDQLRRVTAAARALLPSDSDVPTNW